MDMWPKETLHIRNMLILDRDAHTGDLELLTDDIMRVRRDPRITNIVPDRDIAYRNPNALVAEFSKMIESGHGSAVRGTMAIGGKLGESIGTGWFNIQRVLFGEILHAFGDPKTPVAPLTSRTIFLSLKRNWVQEVILGTFTFFAIIAFTDFGLPVAIPAAIFAGFSKTIFRLLYGMMVFIAHAVGISEDIWAVQQAARAQIGFGVIPRFLQSKSKAHKLRETESQRYWWGAFIRWSGGFLQKAKDLIMQRIHDYGPFSVFLKEVRRGAGRFFLSAPFALFNIALMALLVRYNLMPFIGINLAFWLIGIILNQILTAHGGIAYQKGAGFNYIAGYIPGMIVASIVLSWTGLDANTAFNLALPLAVIAFIISGFAVGTSRWLTTRFRDMIGLAMLQIVHVTGQFVRQTLEFVISGEDKGETSIWEMIKKPFTKDMQANFFTVRTAVIVGVVLTLLNLMIIRDLTTLNLIMLFTTLMVDIGAAVSAFATNRKVGSSFISKDWLRNKFLGYISLMLPKILGWVFSGMAYWYLSGYGVDLMTSTYTLMLGAAFIALPILLWTTGKLVLKYSSIIAQGWGRFTSDLMRNFVVASLIFVWFVMVPMSSSVTFNWFGELMTVTLSDLITIIKWPALLIGFIIGYGKIVGVSSAFVWRYKYKYLVRTFNNKKSTLSANIVTLVTVLINDVKTYVDHWDYSDANIRYREAFRLMDERKTTIFAGSGWLLPLFSDVSGVVSEPERMDGEPIEGPDEISAEAPVLTEEPAEEVEPVVEEAAPETVELAEAPAEVPVPVEEVAEPTASELEDAEPDDALRIEAPVIELDDEAMKVAQIGFLQKLTRLVRGRFISILALATVSLSLTGCSPETRIVAILFSVMLLAILMLLLASLELKDYKRICFPFYRHLNKCVEHPEGVGTRTRNYFIKNRKTVMPKLIRLLKQCVNKRGYISEEQLYEYVGICTALSIIGPAAEEALPVLMDGVRKYDKIKKISACKAVGAIGPAAKEAISDLLVAFGYHEPYDVNIAIVVAQAIERINGGDRMMAEEDILRILNSITDRYTWKYPEYPGYYVSRVGDVMTFIIRIDNRHIDIKISPTKLKLYTIDTIVYAGYSHGAQEHMDTSYTIPETIEEVEGDFVRDETVEFLSSLNHFRGTMDGFVHSPKGYVRLDPPGGELEESRVEEMVEILKMLAVAVNPHKRLHLLDQARQAIEKHYGITLPAEPTLYDFFASVMGLEIEATSKESESAPQAPQFSKNTVRRSTTIADPLGLHVANANLIADKASTFADTNIFLQKGIKYANAKDVSDLLTLAAGQGDEVEVIADGINAENAVNALIEIIETDKKHPIDITGLKRTAIGTGIATIAFGGLTYAAHDITIVAIVLGLIAGYSLVISLTSLITRRYIARALGKRAGPIAETITREDGTKYIKTAPEFDQFKDNHPIIAWFILLHERTHLYTNTILSSEFVGYTLPVLGLFNPIEDYVDTMAEFLAQRDVDEVTKESLREKIGSEKADVLMLMGCSEIKIVEEAADIYKKGLVGKIIATGGVGHETERLRENLKKDNRYMNIYVAELAEAKIFRKILLINGVPSEDIILESTSTNTEKNIRNTILMLEKNGYTPQNLHSMIIMQHPALQKRAIATFDKIMAEESNSKWSINRVSYAAFIPYASVLNAEERSYYLEIMLGEVDRLERYYPQFIVKVEIPNEVRHIASEYAVKRTKTQSIIIGIPEKGLDAEGRAKAEALVSSVGYEDIEIVFLEGDTEEANMQLLEAEARERGIVAAALLDTDLDHELSKEILSTFIDRTNAELFSLVSEDMKSMSREELRVYAKKHAAVYKPITAVLGDRTLYELKTMQVYQRHGRALNVVYNNETIKKLKALKDENKTKYVVWTTGVEHKGLPLAVDIKERRRRMNVTKATDPVKDILIITDERVKTEADKDRYLKITGLDGAIDRSNVILRSGEKDLVMRSIADEIGASVEDVVFAGERGEFARDRAFMLVELSEKAEYNAGLYRWVMELLARGDEAVKEGLEQKRFMRLGDNCYRYLPPVAPKDYSDEFRRYLEYVEEVLTKA